MNCTHRILVALLAAQLLMLGIPTPTHAQVGGAPLPDADPEAGRPFLTNFAPADYDANVQNWAVVEDERGVIFAGNGNGLLEFDGASWRFFQLPNQSAVRSLARDAEGRIWVGGSRDLGYLAPDSLGRTTFVSLRDEVPEAHRDFTEVWDTHATDEGIYFQTRTAIFRWDGEAMQVWPAGEEGFHVLWEVDGTLYVRKTGVGLFRMERTEGGHPASDTLRLVPGGEQVANTRLYALLPYDEKQVLIGTRDEGLFIYDGKRFEPFQTEADALLRTGIIYNGTVLPGGRFAFGTLSEGLVVIDRAGRLILHLDREAGLQSDEIFYSYADRAGNLWLALGNGITRVDVSSPFTQYGAREGVTALPLSMTRHKGRFFADTGSAGMVVLDAAAGHFRPVENTQDQAFSLLSVGGDLLATLGGVRRIVERPDGGYRAEPVWLGFQTYALHPWGRDSSRVLVGLADGLAVLKKSGTGWVGEGRVPEVDAPVRYIAEDLEGTLWTGHNATGQVFRVRLPDPTPDGRLDLSVVQVTAFGIEQGLTEGYNAPFRVGEEVYIAGREGEIFRFDEKAERFVRDHTFGEGPIGRLREDSEGRVWSRYGPAVGYPQRDGTGGYVFESFPSLRTASIFDFYPESNGVVWMQVSDGLIRYDTRISQAESFPPLIRRVLVADDSLLYGGMGPAPSLEVAHEVGSVRFAYAAPGATGPVRYRSRLDGFDTGWSSWTTETYRAYTNLPAGTYRFRVEAEQRGETDITLTVLPPWYQTWWAYGLYAMLFVLGVFVADRIQRRRLLRKEREKARERELEQAREIERAYTELKATKDRLVHSEKMASLGALTAGIAHEIKNPLNFVNNFAEVNGELTDDVLAQLDAGDLSEARALLLDLKRNAQVIVQHGKRADGIVHAMMKHASGGTGQREATDVHQLVSEYIDLAYHGKRAQQMGFTCTIEQDFDEEAGRVELVPQEMGRVFLNLLGNAFDAVQEQQAPKVTVCTRRLDSQVEIRVSDNGPGIPSEIRERIFEPFFTTKPTGSGTGLGLSLAYDIVTQGHGGTLTVESREGEGATFVVTLPVSSGRNEKGTKSL